MESDGLEHKLVFLDSQGATRSLRGIISIEDAFVRVTRRDGFLLVPLARVLCVEGWSEGARSP
jgi:hypothetical protein